MMAGKIYVLTGLFHCRTITTRPPPRARQVGHSNRPQGTHQFNRGNPSGSTLLASNPRVLFSCALAESPHRNREFYRPMTIDALPAYGKQFQRSGIPP